jgi:hypothetical protein
MPSARDNPERLECPAEYQARITEVGGLNRYDEPNFKLVWAQTETTRQGGQWEGDDGDWFMGYRDILLGDGLPHWMLLQWCDAGKCIEMPFLPPESDVAFYHANKCAKTGLQLLGEYPYHGKYHIALQLIAKWFVKGELCLKAFPLSTEIIEMMVPIIKASMEVSIESKVRFMRDQREKEDDDYAKTVDDLYRSVKRKSTLAATSWLEDKQRSIEKHANAAFITMLARNRRFQADRRPNA